MTFKLTESSSWLTTDIIYAGGACSGFGVKDSGEGVIGKNTSSVCHSSSSSPWVSLPNG